MQPNAGRTINGVPKHARAFADNPVLAVSGAVISILALTREAIESLPHVSTRAFLTSEELARTPDYDLDGVLLRDILASCGLADGARFACFGAGPYTHPVRIAECDRVIVCDRIDGGPLPVERGGPWRVLIPAHSYNMGVKWLDRIEVTIDEPDDSAARIAEARERARQSRRMRVPNPDMTQRS